MRDEAPRSNGMRFLPFIAFGAMGGAAIGMIGGLTGIMAMEYKAKPWEHGMMLAWNFGVLGGIFGFLLVLRLKPLRLAMHSLPPGPAQP